MPRAPTCSAQVTDVAKAACDIFLVVFPRARLRITPGNPPHAHPWALNVYLYSHNSPRVWRVEAVVHSKDARLNLNLYRQTSEGNGWDPVPEARRINITRGWKDGNLIGWVSMIRERYLPVDKDLFSPWYGLDDYLNMPQTARFCRKYGWAQTSPLNLHVTPMTLLAPFRRFTARRGRRVLQTTLMRPGDPCSDNTVALCRTDPPLAQQDLRSIACQLEDWLNDTWP